MKIVSRWTDDNTLIEDAKSLTGGPARRTTGTRYATILSERLLTRYIERAATRTTLNTPPPGAIHARSRKRKKASFSDARSWNKESHRHLDPSISLAVGGWQMPLVMFWTASAQYYLVALAAILEGTAALTAPAATAADRRRSEFKVIQGGRL